MNIKGKLLEKGETQNITDSFRKREFVVEYAENPQYPEFLKFELIQTNCEQLDSFDAGQEINISFNLKGRKWTDKNGEVKYFNSLQAWRVERVNDIAQPESSAPDAGDMNPPEWLSNAPGPQADDDLPF
ncbi:MAG: DUF3127 domain-containing protein [bacterium]|nr:DUF3127 domain-containing protein [bacterium]